MTYNCCNSEPIWSLRGNGKFHASYQCQKAIKAERVAYESSTVYGT